MVTCVGHFWDGLCEEYDDTLNEQRDFHIMSSLGHSFRLRQSETKRFLFENKFEEIVINGLETDFDYEVSEKATKLFDVLMIENLKKKMLNTKKS